MNEKLAPGFPIRVLVVDDSAFMRTALSRIILSEPGLELVGTARNGTEALGKIPSADPDVVTLDIEMPELGGIETLRQIMKRHPRPVIMVSAVTEKNAEITLDALSAGAFDYLPKDLSETSLDILHIRSDLVAKIRAAALRRYASRDSMKKKPSVPSSTPTRARAAVAPGVVAIGTSTGGPRALQELLPQFPQDFPVPILIVQHMPPGFTTALTKRLDRLCSIRVREGRNREQVEPGVAYIAPAGVHMTVERRGFDSQILISLRGLPNDVPYVPSIDVLMRSVADLYGNCAAGVIMTGMGRDGAEGMNAIYRRGGLTIGQDEASCVVYGMPRVCAQRGLLTSVLPLSQIARELLGATSCRRGA